MLFWRNEALRSRVIFFFFFKVVSTEGRDVTLRWLLNDF